MSETIVIVGEPDDQPAEGVPTKSHHFLDDLLDESRLGTRNGLLGNDRDWPSSDYRE